MKLSVLGRFRSCLLTMVFGLGSMLGGESALAQATTAPVIQMQSGASATQLNAAIYSTASGATIYYTKNGIDPTTSDAVVPGSGLVVVDKNLVLKARAWDGTNWSPVTTRVFNALGRVAAGDDDSIVLKADGRVWATGSNTTGQLGDGTVTTRNTAVSVLSAAGQLLRDVISIEGGTNDGFDVEHTVAAKRDGTVWAWGNNVAGQLGNGNTTASNYPVQVTKIGGSPLTDAIMVAAGNHSSYALLADGTVWSWGINTYGQLGDGSTTTRGTAAVVKINSTTNLTGITAIAAGEYHGLALKQDGTVWAWGYNNVGQVGNGAGPTNALYATQVKATSSIYLTSIASIAAGSISNYAVKTDGTVVGWGGNTNYELGIVSATNQPYPAVMQFNLTGTAFSGVAGIAAGRSHALILKTDGTLWATGSNVSGQAGNGDTVTRSVPNYIRKDSAGNALTSIVSMAGGYGHSVALDSSGVVYAWGRNVRGGLGINSTTASLYAVTNAAWPNAQYVPTNVTLSVVSNSNTNPNSFLLTASPTSGANDIARVDFYQGETLIGSVTSGPWQLAISNASLTEPFSVVAYNYNDTAGVEVTTSGVVVPPILQLRAGATATQFEVTVTCPTPGAVIHYTTNGAEPTTSSPTVVTGGIINLDRNAVVKAKAWDGNTTVTLTTSLTTTAVYNVFGRVAAGDKHMDLLKSDGHLVAAGANGVGQIGDGTTTARLIPVSVKKNATDLLGDVISVEVSSNSSSNSATLEEHTIAAKKDGTVWVWGYNGYSQLGTGNTTNASYPVQALLGAAQPLTNVIAVAAGNGNSFALTASGAVYAWGYNGNGELGDGSTTNRSYAVAVKSDVTTPLSGIIAIAAGEKHALALKDDGSVWSWGLGADGRLGDGTSTNRLYAVKVKTNSTTYLANVVSIAAAIQHGVAITASGAAYSWGDGGNGELGNGTTNIYAYATPVLASVGVPISGVRSVGTGFHTTLFLKNDGTLWATGLNTGGQIGDGTTTTRLFPVQVKKDANNFLTDIVDVAGSYENGIALDNTGKVYTWGNAASGQLGNGSTTAPSTNKYATAYTAWPTLKGTYTSLSLAITASTTEAPGSFRLAATVSQLGDYGLSRVDFYLGSTLVGSDNGSPWTFTISSLSAGDYTFSAIGIDSNGVGGPKASIGGSVTEPAPLLTFQQAGRVEVAPGSYMQVAASAATVFALKSDGTVWQWGAGDSSGLISVPTQTSGLTGIVAIAAGAFHCLALKSDGTAVAWGDNLYGQLGTASMLATTTPLPVSGLTNIVAIAAGTHHSMFLKSDGTVWASGRNDVCQLGDETIDTRYAPVQVIGLSNIVAITAGELHSVALKNNGTVWTWGNNSFSKSQVPTTLPAIAIAAGGRHTLALQSDGSVVAWGGNQVGQLGNNTTTASATPVSVSGLTNVVAIAADYLHSMASKGDGTVWSWGGDEFGQLGNGLMNNTSLVPVQATNLTNAVTVACALAPESPYSFSLALRSDGTIYGWGSNQGGTTGNNLPTGSAVPVQIAGIDHVEKVSADTHHVLALKDDHRVWAWGGNYLGQLGDDTTTERKVPTLVAGITNAIDVAAGSYHSLALNDDGTVFAWGGNGHGQLGDTISAGHRTPTLISGVTGVSHVAAGTYHSLALKSDGTVLAWGSNGQGALGSSTIPMAGHSYSPVAVSSLTDVATISAGDFGSFAIKTDGTVWAWGANNFGQLGNGTTTDSGVPVRAGLLDNVTAVAASNSHTLALKSDGTVWAWGSNSSGQLGDNTTTDRSSPTVVSSLTDIVEIAARGSCSLARKMDGTIWAWGYNSTGEFGDNTTNTFSHVPIQVGANRGIKLLTVGLALKEDGTVEGWGDSSYAQLANGVSLAYPEPIAVRGLNLLHTVPQVAFTNPAPITIFRGDSATLTFTKTPGDGAINEVQLRFEGLTIDTVTGSGTSFTWTPSTWGDFELALVARDANGAYSLRSPEISIHVPIGTPGDIDGDGLLDTWEIEHFGNLNQKATGDWDHDGLTNAEEMLHGTDPKVADTDGDGVLDGIEVLQGRNPLKGAIPDTNGLVNLQVFTPLE